MLFNLQRCQVVPSVVKQRILKAAKYGGLQIVAIVAFG